MAHCDIQKGRAVRIERHRLYERFGKRLFDLIFVLALLPFWLPLSAILWLLAWLETGKGCFADERVGQFGHRF